MFPALEYQVTSSLSVLTLSLLITTVLDDPETTVAAFPTHQEQQSKFIRRKEKKGLEVITLLKS